MKYQLRRWSENYRDSFAAMQCDPEVMADLGGPAARAASDEKFDRYRDAWTTDGISRWAVVDHADNFLGYSGVMKRCDPNHPLGVHFEIGWRFRRDAWGQGFATGSAKHALGHAWTALTIPEIVSYTAWDNYRSQKVMSRLGLRRDDKRDFTARYPHGDWAGLLWVADRPMTDTPE